jgi:phosphatidylserine synthase
MTYLVPHNDGWLFYGMPATIAITSALLLTVVSFKQRALWYWMALIFVVVLAMSVWLKWQVEDSDKWRQHEVFMFYGWRLLLMAMLALPWIQYSLRVSREQTRYAHFIHNCGLTR